MSQAEEEWMQGLQDREEQSVFKDTTQGQCGWIQAGDGLRQKLSQVRDFDPWPKRTGNHLGG